MKSDVTAKDFNPSNNDLVDAIKAAANELAEVVSKLPDGSERRRAISLTHIEAASMFAVKGIFYGDDNERTDV